MKLRKLKEKDAPGMLAWMHDPEVVEYMAANFAQKTLADCLAFIRASEEESRDIHRAVADEEDRYMGTVSLKHLDREKARAEFAITMSREAMGNGYSHFGMREILRFGFEELGLDQIYWYVSPRNQRAIHFYDREGCRRIGQIPDVPQNQGEEYIWYQAENPRTVGACPATTAGDIPRG